MARYLIISTYPSSGSQNAGDHLITTSLCSLLNELDQNAEFDIVWRAASWMEVKSLAERADHIFFACLAIRENMFEALYPYLEDILRLRVRYSIVSAGTQLPVEGEGHIFTGMKSTTLSRLLLVERGSQLFSTRGALTQMFCEQAGLKSAKFDGDIAFFDRRFDGRKFEELENVNRIVVSDPHYFEVYEPAFCRLIAGLASMFPKATTEVVLHGVNPRVEAACRKMRVDFTRVYEQQSTGLDVYEDFDMHVGFRVHGHVSALKRRKVSYLLEQDGRGSDYGATIPQHITVPAYRRKGLPELKPRNVLRGVLGKEIEWRSRVPVSSVDQVLAMIRNDSKHCFEKFRGLEASIAQYNEAAFDSLKACLDLNK